MPDSDTPATAPPSPPVRYGGEQSNRYSPLTPLFWHGMRVGEWVRLLREHRFGLTGRGYRRFCTISPVAVLNSIASLYERLKYRPRVNRVELPAAPIFVLGHWRSGTTMLHEMLIRDPQHAYPDTYQCYTPHHFNMSRRWVTPITAWMLPKQRPMDNVAAGWSRPQEDEFALMNLGLPSPYRCWAFPDDGPVDTEALTLAGFSSDELTRWKAALEYFIKAVTLRDERRMVLKSPPHTARIGVLLDIFPNAKFVHITRDPLTLFPSTVRLWQSMCDTQGLQTRRQHHPWIEPLVLDNLAAMYAAFERDRPAIPDGQFAEIRYEQLVAQPHDELGRVYAELDLGDFSRVEPNLAEYLGENKSYQTNRYQLAPEVEATIRQRWSRYFELFGYEN